MIHDEEPSPRLGAEDRTDPDIEVIFLGTGTSSSIPNLACLTAPPSKEPCRTCLSTLTPVGRKNIRRNTSAVVRVTAGKDRKTTTLVIDVGKNFQAAAIEWFPKYGLREIDGVLLTHAHADAINGLDDLRGWTLGNAIQGHIDVYLSQDTFRDVKRAFPYLVAKEFASGGGDVPDFKWHIIEDKVPFEIKNTGIRVTPFSVIHGRVWTSALPMSAPTSFEHKTTTRPYFCFGFLVEDAIAYLSDVSEIPEDAWTVIQSRGQKSVLVIDCLRLRPHTSHMGAREAAVAVQRIGARRSYMVGFNHDLSQEEWEKIGERVGEGDRLGEGLNEREKKGLDLMQDGLGGKPQWVRPAHDGLRVVCQGGRVWDETYA